VSVEQTVDRILADVGVTADGRVTRDALVAYLESMTTTIPGRATRSDAAFGWLFSILNERAREVARGY